MASQPTARAPEAAIALGWVLAIAVTFVLVIRGIASGYSYWFDELFSVVHNSASLQTLWNHRSDDVHPPQYPVLLWAWMSLWGPSEIATRSLSAIFAGLAAFTPLLLVPRYGKVFAFAASMLIVTNPLVVFYAQEVRDYALLLFGSTLTLCAFLDRRRRLFFAAVLMTGLAHYFGTLLAMTMLFLHLLREPRSRREFGIVAVAGLVLILWPVYQATRGIAGAAMGGNFWIKTTPLESIALAARVISPQIFWLFSKVGIFGGVILGLFVVGGVAATVRRTTRERGRALFARADETDRGIAWIVAAGILVVLGVATISLHSPIAIERNYIVLLPIQGLILAWVVNRVVASKFRWIGLAIFCAYCGLGVHLGIEKLRPKTLPIEDWKVVAARAARLVRGTGLPLYYVINHANSEEKFIDFYLPADIRARPIRREAMDTLPDRVVVVFAIACQLANNSRPVTELFDRFAKPVTLIKFSGWQACGMGIVTTGSQVPSLYPVPQGG